MEKSNNPTPIEITNILDVMGYTMFPEKQLNGQFKVKVWRFDEYKGIGKTYYECAHECILKTERDFYNKFFNVNKK